MAGTFTTPALSAWPAELMRSCSFADNFKTITRIEDNHGTDTGTGNTADRGLTVDGNGYISYDVVSQASGFSVKIQFLASATSTGILIGNANLISGVAADGWTVWVDATGVRANHSNGVAIPTRCSVDIAYADSVKHTVTYVVDMTGNTHDLYVDALDVDSVATTINETIGEATAVTAGGDGTNNFIGTLYGARVFDALLTESEHDEYHAGTFPSFFKSPYAAYKCDAYSDHDIGFTTQTGTFKLVEETVDSIARVNITCLTAGVISVPTSFYGDTPTEAAHRQWEFYLKKTGAGAAPIIAIINGIAGQVVGGGINDGYIVDISGGEAVECSRIDNGSVTNKFATAASFVNVGQRYLFRVTRSEAGVMTVYMDGTIIDVSGGSGTNPFTDTTITTSNYVALDLDADDEVIWLMGGTSKERNAIWDRTINQRDLHKADQLQLIKFPTFTTDSVGQTYYDFDGANDYIGNLPTLPTTYTITAALRASASALPTIQQDNDGTLTDDLIVAGAHTGFLHSMVIHSGVLNQLQLYHDEYQHLYNLWHGRSYGAFARLGVEGSQQLSVFLDYSTDPYDDHSPNQRSSALQVNTTQNGTAGVSFDASNSAVTYDHNAVYQMSTGTIFVYLLDNGQNANSGVLVDKGTNYKLSIVTAVDGPRQATLSFNGSDASVSGLVDDIETVCVVFRDGFKPRFSMNGIFLGEGLSTVVVDDSDTTGLVIGNENAFADETPFDLKQVHIFNRPLADHEIIALHQQARYINNIPV